MPSGFTSARHCPGKVWEARTGAARSQSTAEKTDAVGCHGRRSVGHARSGLHGAAEARHRGQSKGEKANRAERSEQGRHGCSRCRSRPTRRPSPHAIKCLRLIDKEMDMTRTKVAADSDAQVADPSVDRKALLSEALRRRIVSMEMAPGAVVDELALSEEFGLSRPPSGKSCGRWRPRDTSTSKPIGQRAFRR